MVAGVEIEIKHNSTYQTVYAHMSKFGSEKKGVRVKQGQIIGYTGSTGLLQDHIYITS